MTKIIAVFGSARIQPEQALYKDCYDVGQALAQSGYITMTGGYAGVMEAASRGAAEADGHVQGITVASLEYIGESRANQWLTEEIRYETLHERINHLVVTASAYVVMPGGLGTAQELIEVWQGMRLGDYDEKPLIVYGEFWKPVIEQMLQEQFISERDTRLITYTNDTQGMITALENWFSKEKNS